MKNNYTSTPPLTELEFAYEVRRALDESVAVLPAHTRERLIAARRLAVSHKKSEAHEFIFVQTSGLAGFSGSHFTNPFNGRMSWLKRAGMVIPLLILVIGSLSIYQYEQQRRIHALADIDVAVLTDDLPLNAYLDHGFDTYLNKHGE